MAIYTICVVRETGAIRWVLPHAPDAVATRPSSEDIVHVETADVVSPTTHRLIDGQLERLSAGEQVAARAALLDETLDTLLKTSDIAVMAAVTNMNILFSELSTPTAEQISAYREAVRTTAKTLLAAQLGG